MCCVVSGHGSDQRLAAVKGWGLRITQVPSLCGNPHTVQLALLWVLPTPPATPPHLSLKREAATLPSDEETLVDKLRNKPKVTKLARGEARA